ncbi:MAG: GNAT family N-acetyltransferase [Actinomycetia bacterium]|nr:GNAT family N-acetyltransferase [Actinomycetes bacterium]
MTDQLKRNPAKVGEKGNPTKARLTISAIRDFQSLSEIREEWAELVRTARLGSPFAHPAWSMTWAEHFVPEGDLEYVAVRETDEGRLIGMAPFYRRHRSMSRLTMTTIQPIGTGQGEPLTEGVHLVALPNRARDVLCAVVQHVAALPNSDWAQVSVGEGQGWPLPQWLDGDSDGSIQHRKVRPCVVLDDLPEDPELVLPGLKRNLRESLRRARNRSAKMGNISFRGLTDPVEVADAVPEIIRLHTMRSEMRGKVTHANMLGGRIDDFLADAAVRLAREGLASVQLAEHSGVPVAAQLVLSDGSADYISVSGLDPKYWDLNLNTMLIFKAVQAAVTAGRNSVNLSTGPNVAKMRWSSKVVTQHDFDIVPMRRRSQLLHQVYSQAASALDSRQELRRHRVLGAGEQSNRWKPRMRTGGDAH